MILSAFGVCVSGLGKLCGLVVWVCVVLLGLSSERWVWVYCYLGCFLALGLSFNCIIGLGVLGVCALGFGVLRFPLVCLRFAFRCLGGVDSVWVFGCRRLFRLAVCGLGGFLTLGWSIGLLFCLLTL